MAIERRIDTATWDDPWFADLDVSGKLLFLYLLTNRRTTSCGAFEITLRAIAFETGIDMDRVEELLESFGERVQWFPGHQVIFVRNFYRRQKPNASFTTNAQRAAANLPREVRDTVFAVYPELRTGCETADDTLPTPCLQGGDTPSLELELERELELAPEPEPERESRAARAAAQVDTPFSVYAAFMDVVSDPSFTPAPKWKDKQLGIAKRLIEQGYGTDKVRRCVVFMRSQSWRTDPFDLGNVEKYIGTWEVNGEPEREQPANGRSRAAGAVAPQRGSVAEDDRRRGYSYDDVVAGHAESR